MKKNISFCILLISVVTLLIYLEPQLFKEYSFVFSASIDKVYKILKLLSAAAVFIIFFVRKIKISRILLFVTILQIIMFISTFLNNGDIVRFFGPALTTIVMTMLAEILITEKKLYSTLKIVNIYLRICFLLNLVSIILIDFTNFNQITNVYFLGIDNRFIFTFIPWIVFEGIVSIYENKRLNKKWFLITLVCEFILLYRSSVAAMLIMFLYPIIYIFYSSSKKISNFKITTFLAYIILNLSIVVFKIQNIFSEFLSFLGKDITLSGRTFIWDGILKNSKEKIFIGNGMQSIVYDKNFFYQSSAPYYLNHCKVIHGHNSIMTILYRGGIASVLCYLLVLYDVLANVKTCKNYNLKILLYTTVVVILMLSLFDTIDFACLYFIFTICSGCNRLIVKKVKNYE